MQLLYCAQCRLTRSWDTLNTIIWRALKVMQSELSPDYLGYSFVTWQLASV